MKGFIEVNADLQYEPRMIAVDLIESFCNHEVVTASMSYCVKETCDEIKALIEEAQKEVTVNLPSVQTLPIRDYEGIITTSSASMDTEGNVVAVELAKLVGEKNEREHMVKATRK